MRLLVQCVWLILATTHEPLAPLCEAAAAAAGIFGRRGGNGGNGSDPRDAASQSERPKPPPTIPLPPAHATMDGTNPPLQTMYDALPTDETSHGNRLPPPIPLGLSGLETVATLQTNTPTTDFDSMRHQIIPPPLPPPPQWEPPMASDGSWFETPQGPHDTYPNEALTYSHSPHDDQLYFLQQELQEAHRREQELRDELHNLTAWSAVRQQREMLHSHQLDVLTERVVQVETAAATDRLQMLEYQANCTELSLQLSAQDELVVEWRTQCEALVAQRSVDEAQLESTRHQLKVATNEAEELAAMIEHHRLWQESTTKQKPKRWGVWAWLFGWATSDDEPDDAVSSGSIKDRYMDNPKYKQMQETARSTLLTALRTERNSVNELELALTTWQQNNSAIAEQVQSRDQIIDELNHRIAVFEEDKVVLKAALRQLQMEMKDEAPKVQQLANDLAEAEHEADRLVEEMEALTQRHGTEMAALERVIEEKERAMAAAESNLTVIGTYVDKLEERLADFTVARRDMEGRELAYTEAETKAKEALGQRDGLQQRVLELEHEHDELKVLLAELARERGKLQTDHAALVVERAALHTDVQSLRQSYAKLDNEAKGLRTSSDQYMLEQVQRELNETLAAKNELLQQLNRTSIELWELRNVSHSAKASAEEQGKLLQQATATQHTLQQRIAQLEVERHASSQTQRSLQEKSQQALEMLRNELVQAQEAERRVVNETQRALAKAESEHQVALGEARKSLEPIEMMASEPAAVESNASLSHANNTGRLASGSMAPLMPGTPIRQQDANPPRREFGNGSNRTINATNVIVPTQASLGTTNQTSTRRKVPLRPVRKFLARATGIHGLFTKPSTLPTPLKPTASQPPKTVTPKVNVVPPSKPNEVKHTLWGMKYQQSKGSDTNGKT